ncbi:hypothetical protein MKW92_027798 [Papaver armeniacum]|nr:hypothetical protein MKW92_027798 [Papaver armeniacum]
MISRKVAVIGAGAAGLVASRELLREGHEVVVFERSDRVGGTWVYDPNVDSDPLGLDPSRTIIHSSLYESLRTNLPRETMGFRDYPFVAQVKDDRRDPRRFPHHSEVLHYLEDFANHFELIQLIRFETEVIYAGLLEEEEELKNSWVVKSRKKGEVGNSSVAHEVFDAVVVCSGHYTHPNIAEIPGIDAWPGKQLHSHNYRVPEPLNGQVVLIIGNSVSAEDISKEISTVAKEVHVASRSTMDALLTKRFGCDNMWLHSMVKSAHEDGTIVFSDGSLSPVDVIVHCTRYKYYFPFLEINNIVAVDDSCVGPLYKHIFPPMLAPTLSFIGIPFWVDWLAAESGCQPWEEWRKQMLKEHVSNYLAWPETYRDEWEDEYLIVQAQEDFCQYSPREF